MSLKSLSVTIGADTSEFSQGIRAVTDGIKATQETAEKVSKSLASQAASLASEYKKQGVNASEAFKKAWSEIERTSSQSSKSKNFGLKNIFSGFNSSAKSAKNSADELKKSLSETDNAFSAVSDGIKTLVSSAFALVGVTAIVKGLVQAFQAYTSLESSVNRVTNIFEDSARYIQYFAQNTAKSLGMAESSVYEYAATYGNLFKNITYDTYENAKVTIAMLQASAVVASKTGRTMEDVMERIRSGLLGNTEAIEDLGINVNVAMLEVTDAFSKIADGRSWEQLTFYEQQQIRTLAILEQASGNFGDEIQQGSAFSVSVLTGAFEDLSSTAGELVNEVFQPIIKYLTTTVQSITTALQSLNTDGLQPVVNMLHNIVQYAVTALKSLVNLIGIDITFSETDTGIPESFSVSAESSGEISDNMENTEKTAKKLKKTLAGFDELNVLSVPDTDNTSLADISSSDTGTTKSVFSSLPDLEISDEPALTVDIDTSGLERNLAKVKNNLKPLTDSLSGLWDALKPFAKNVGEGLLWFCENVLAPIGKWSFNVLLPFALDSLSSVIGILDAVIEGFKPMGEWLWNNFLEPVSNWAGNIITSGLENLADALESTAKWCGENKTSASLIFGLSVAVLALNSAIKTNAFSTFFTNLGNGIKALGGIDVTIGTIIAGIAGWVYAITEVVKNWDDIVSVVKQDGGIFNFISNWIDSCRQDVENFFNHLPLGNFGKKWYDFWSKAGEIVYTVFNEIPKKVAIIVTNIILRLKKEISEFVSNPKNWIDGHRQNIENFFNNLPFGGLGKKWYDSWSKIGEAVYTVFNEIPKKIKTIGTNIILGLQKGITDFFNDPIKWLKEHIADPIINGFKSLFGIHSPSTVMAELGEYIIAGLYNSISAGINQVAKIFSEILASIKNVFSGIGEWFKEVFSTAWENIKEIFSGVGEWFSNRWEDITTAFSGIGDWFSEQFQSAYNSITEIFSGIGEWFSNRWNDITTALSDVGEWFKETFQTAWNNITEIFSGVGEWFSERWNDIVAVFSVVGEWFKEIFSVAWEQIQNAWSNVTKWFSDIWDNIKKTFSKVGEWFKEKFQKARDNITRIFSGIGNWFSDRWKEIKNIFNSVGEWFSKKFQSAYNSITEIFSSIGEWFSNRWNDITTALSDVGEWFKETFQTAWNNITEIFSGAGEWFSNRWEDITTAFSGIGDWFSEQFQSAYNSITEIFSSIGEWFSNRWNDITTALSDVGEWFKETFQTAWNNITEIFSGAGEWFSNRWEDITTAFSGIGDWFSEQFQSAYDNITGIFSNLSGWFGDIWSNVSDGAKEGLNWIIDKINDMIYKLNSFSFDLPSFLGGGTIGFDIPEIPYLAKGGVVSSPTLAMIGEAGKEAVLPLQNNTGWITDISSKLWDSMKQALQNIVPENSNPDLKINILAEISGIPKIEQPAVKSPVYNYQYETYNMQRNLYTNQTENQKQNNNLPPVNVYLYPNSRAFKRDVLNAYREEIARGGKIN